MSLCHKIFCHSTSHRQTCTNRRLVTYTRPLSPFRLLHPPVRRYTSSFPTSRSSGDLVVSPAGKEKIGNFEHMDLIIAEELLKRKFDQQALQNVSGKSYYDSYCQLKQQNEHVSTIILNRIRKWLGLRGLIPQTLVSQSKKRLCEGDIACVFQAINRIPKYFLPHFRNAITFCKEKIPRDRAPLPTAFSHGTALIIHSFVHPEIRPIISRLVYNEGNADQTLDWKRVMDETSRLSSQFKNPFSLEYPELWGIDPS
jgi:hypothetical protein